MVSRSRSVAGRGGAIARARRSVGASAEDVRGHHDVEAAVRAPARTDIFDIARSLGGATAPSGNEDVIALLRDAVTKIFRVADASTLGSALERAGANGVGAVSGCAGAVVGEVAWTRGGAADDGRWFERIGRAGGAGSVAGFFGVARTCSTAAHDSGRQHHVAWTCGTTVADFCEVAWPLRCAADRARGEPLAERISGCVRVWRILRLVTRAQPHHYQRHDNTPHAAIISPHVGRVASKRYSQRTVPMTFFWPI